MVSMKQFTKLQCFGAGLLLYTYLFIKKIHRGNDYPGLKQGVYNSVTKCGSHSLILFTWVPKELGFTQVCLGYLKCCFIRGLKGYTLLSLGNRTEAERHQVNTIKILKKKTQTNKAQSKLNKLKPQNNQKERNQRAVLMHDYV